MPPLRTTLRQILNGFARSFKVLTNLFDADSWDDPLRGPLFAAVLPFARLPTARRPVRLALEELEARINLSLPIVMMVSPSLGPTGGGTTVSITGTNFEGATAVGGRKGTRLDNTKLHIIIIESRPLSSPSSTFPHLNYDFGGVKGHLFLKTR